MDNTDQVIIDEIKRLIATLPADQREACNELAHHMRMQIKSAGAPVGTLAIALVGAEMQGRVRVMRFNGRYSDLLC